MHKRDSSTRLYIDYDTQVTVKLRTIGFLFRLRTYHFVRLVILNCNTIQKSKIQCNLIFINDTIP